MAARARRRLPLLQGAQHLSRSPSSSTLRRRPGQLHGILFDADNPCARVLRRGAEHRRLHPLHRRGGSPAGSRSRCSQPPDPRAAAIRTLMLTPWIVRASSSRCCGSSVAERRRDCHKILVDYTGCAPTPRVAVGRELALRDHNPIVWRGLPFAMLIFFAGLQAIPPNCAEAAAIDGAGPPALPPHHAAAAAAADPPSNCCSA